MHINKGLVHLCIHIFYFQLQGNPLGSVISLDPDRLNEKNEARLKKLKSIAGKCETDKHRCLTVYSTTRSIFWSGSLAFFEFFSDFRMLKVLC